MNHLFSGKPSLSKKWLQHLRKIHTEKLKNIKPVIDQSSPAEFLHLRIRKKQEQQKEGKIKIDRYTEIEKANRLLLEKMSNIMNSKSPSQHRFKKKSLNQEIRKRDLEKIAGDNQAILRRLQCRTPVYSTHKLEKE